MGRGSGTGPASPAWERRVRSIPFPAMAWASSPKKPGVAPLRRRSSQSQRETINTFMARVSFDHGFEELFHREALIFPEKLTRPGLGCAAIDAALRQGAHGGGEGLG